MKKSRLNDKQKRIINIVITVVQIILVLFAITFAAIVLANPNIESAEVSGAGVKLLPVLSGSMAGGNPDSFNEGDLVVAKVPKDKTALEVGEIVTFKGIDENGRTALVTHRIVLKTVTADGTVVYETEGDAPGASHDRVLADEVLAVYSFHIAGLGGAIQWLQQPTNFLLAIVLPLIVLFIYNIIMFVRMLLIAKFNKQVEAAGAADEEEIKRRAVEEYLAKREAGETAFVSEPDASHADEGSETNPGDGSKTEADGGK